MESEVFFRANGEGGMFWKVREHHFITQVGVFLHKVNEQAWVGTGVRFFGEHFPQVSKEVSKTKKPTKVQDQLVKMNVFHAHKIHVWCIFTCRLVGKYTIFIYPMGICPTHPNNQTWVPGGSGCISLGLWHGEHLQLPRSRSVGWVGWIGSFLGGGNSNILYFHPYLGKISNLN